MGFTFLCSVAGRQRKQLPTHQLSVVGAAGQLQPMVTYMDGTLWCDSFKDPAHPNTRFAVGLAPRWHRRHALVADIGGQVRPVKQV